MLYLQAAVLVWVITTVVKKTFFGTLRAAEVEVYITIFSLISPPLTLQLRRLQLHLSLARDSLSFLMSCHDHLISSSVTHAWHFLSQHLVEKSWYAVLETFILLAGFHQDLQLAFVGSITLLFVMKAFHWLTEERIDYVRTKIRRS